MDAPPFPLPLGHTFGAAGGDLSRHDGRTWPDGERLSQWQSAYCGRWRRPLCTPTGRYDGPTQAGVAEIQQHLGLPVTGLLGPDEWAAVWELPPPAPPEPAPKPAVSESTRRAILARRLDYWRKYSKYKIRYGSDPNAPAWYPGRPFGPHEYGDHVTRVQEILGYKTTGRFSLAMGKRIRGLQRAWDVPVSGLVDARTAALLDPVDESEAT